MIKNRSSRIVIDKNISFSEIEQHTSHTPFTVLFVYYWLFQYGIGTFDLIEVGSATYYLLVLPAILFVVIYVYLFKLIGFRLVSPAALCMGVYLLLVSSVAITRADWQTLYSQLLFSGMILVVFWHRMTISSELINYLFLASIPLSIIAHVLGNNTYAVLPYMTNDEEYPWRISLFPSAAQSAYFSLVILFVNIYYKKVPFRRMCLAGSLYFLVFAGTRSALIAAAICGGWGILVWKGVLSSTTSKFGYVIVCLIFFIAIVALPQIMLALPNFGDSDINTYITRSSEGFQDESEVAISMYRGWIWQEHLRLASENPLFGIGTFNFTELMMQERGFNSSNGSEAFLTGLYARVGAPCLLVLGALFFAARDALKAGTRIPLNLMIIIIVAMLAYGSFVNAYNSIFLLMIGLLNVANPFLGEASLAKENNIGGSVSHYKYSYLRSMMR